jgi:hypothetical protein
MMGAMEEEYPEELQKEYLLHKIVAVSGFLFALLVLPVVQHVLVASREAAQPSGIAGQSAPENGEVAGVSTESQAAAVAEEQALQGSRPAVQRYASVAACLEDQEAQLKQLEQWGNNVKLRALEKYLASTQDDPERTQYEAKIKAIDLAVGLEWNRIQGRSCQE